MMAYKEIRRPVLYLLVAVVVAAAAMLLTGGGTGSVTSSGSSLVTEQSNRAAPEECPEILAGLRPDGPLPAPGAMPAESTMARIAERGRLVAGVNQSEPLIGHRDPRTGVLSGADIDIVEMIAEAIFGDPSRVQFVAVSIADRVPALLENRVDLVVNSFTITCARQRDIEFSAPYRTAGARVLVPVESSVQGVNDLVGLRTCTSRGSTYEHDLVTRVPDANRVVRSGVPECMVALQRGEVDALISDEVIVAGLAAEDPQVRIVDVDMGVADVGVGIRKDAPDLARFVNGVLEQARADGAVDASMQRWFGGELQVLPVQPAPRYRD